jgi:hypothetical protein
VESHHPGWRTCLQVQAGHSEVLATPVRVKGIGPVLALDDIVGHKACAMAARAASRDFVNRAALQEYRRQYRWTRLIELARGRDPGLELADFTDAVRRLDRAKRAQSARPTRYWLAGQGSTRSFDH